MCTHLPPTRKKCLPTLNHPKYSFTHPPPTVKKCPSTQNIPLPTPQLVHRKCSLTPIHPKYTHTHPPIKNIHPRHTSNQPHQPMKNVTQNIPPHTPNHPKYTSTLHCQTIKKFHPVPLS